MKYKGIVILLVCMISSSVLAGDIERIVVTGSRIDVFNSPAVTLVKPADYLIQKIKLLNDSRDKELREKELTNTVKKLLNTANNMKFIEISVGDEIIYPISVDNFQLDMVLGDRPDTSMAYLYIKTPIKNGLSVNKSIKHIEHFISKAKKIGRTVFEKQGELVLSIVNPEKYRDELLKLISTDLNKTINVFGDKYSAEISGLSQSLQWERDSLSELKLYLEYDFTLNSK